MQSRDLPRLIPAHAGKTSGRPSPAALGRAHPRSRGENEGGHVDVDAGRGSSPLTRGKRLNRVLNRVGAGLIPAHAGKTDTRRAGTSITSAHPRSRGENLWLPPGRLRAGGSSPLTRGKRGRVGGDAWRGWLIPAHAGKTRESWSAGRRPTAHPRSRGENYATRRDPRRPSGSSPLTRGKLLKGLNGLLECRLIPAHAGKTMKRFLSSLVDAAHPRSRGENCHLLPPILGGRGSSPLTRGKQGRHRVDG